MATAVHVALALDRPLLLEGEAGVGKTEVAQVLAALLGRRLIRLQCYEGIDAGQALYEWDHARQLLAIRAREASGETDGRVDERLFGPEFLLERPLLHALAGRVGAPVLLIDEIDRADDEFEAFLLEMLSDFQVTIPELGTITRRAPAAGGPHLQPHARAARRAQAPLPLPLDRLPERRARARDRRPPRARASSALARQVVAAVAPAARSWSWPSHPASPRRSTGRARLDLLGEHDLTADAADLTLGSVLKEREDLELAREHLDEVVS